MQIRVLKFKLTPAVVKLLMKMYFFNFEILLIFVPISHCSHNHLPLKSEDGQLTYILENPVFS